MLIHSHIQWKRQWFPEMNNWLVDWNHGTLWLTFPSYWEWNNIPTDFRIFFRGVGEKPPTSLSCERNCALETNKPRLHDSMLHSPGDLVDLHLLLKPCFRKYCLCKCKSHMKDFWWCPLRFRDAFPIKSEKKNLRLVQGLPSHGWFAEGMFQTSTVLLGLRRPQKVICWWLLSVAFKL